MFTKLILTPKIRGHSILTMNSVSCERQSEFSKVYGNYKEFHQLDIQTKLFHNACYRKYVNINISAQNMVMISVFVISTFNKHAPLGTSTIIKRWYRCEIETNMPKKNSYIVKQLLKNKQRPF